ncbi:MAG: HAD family hydrolase [Paramuribaculum sp.]|nr:HAD family hydrolase [Paramuribaculum sp.]MDE7470337.1 HAD family hydrolase [Paramuribaculum sp.]
MSRIDYDLSRIRAVAFDVDGVLSPSTIPMGPDGIPMRMANIKDGYAMQLAAKCGLKMVIITGANTPAIEVRYKALGIDDVYLKAAHKLPILNEWMSRNGLAPEEVAYVGDDIPDIAAMKAVGLKVCPADAAVDVRVIADYISPSDGGYGVARDLLEQILRAKGQWMADEKAFGW